MESSLSAATNLSSCLHTTFTDVPNRNGDYKVGNKVIDLTNKYAKLGAWVAKIRTQFKLFQVNRASSYLKAEHIKSLRTMGTSLHFLISSHCHSHDLVLIDVLL